MVNPCNTPSPPPSAADDLPLEPRPQLAMEPGKEYLGWASINTYGEMHFRPKVREEGTAAEGAETLRRSEGITICQTKKTFILHMTLQKDSLTISRISNKMLLAAQLLNQYLKRK